MKIPLPIDPTLPPFMPVVASQASARSIDSMHSWQGIHFKIQPGMECPLLFPRKDKEAATTASLPYQTSRTQEVRLPFRNKLPKDCRKCARQIQSQRPKRISRNLLGSLILQMFPNFSLSCTPSTGLFTSLSWRTSGCQCWEIHRNSSSSYSIIWKKYFSISSLLFRWKQRHLWMIFLLPFCSTLLLLKTIAVTT